MRRAVLTILLALMPQVHAHAEGAVSGGGGKAVVCRNADGSLKSAELLDLWEARSIYGRAIQPSEDTLEAQVAAAVERAKFVTFNPYRVHTGRERLVGAEAFKEYLALDIRRFSEADFPGVTRLRGVHLTDTPDAYELARPADCSIEQVVNYLDLPRSPQILINQDLWEKMDLVNRAALILHETLYSYLRRNSAESNSVRTRRIVGYVMSGREFVSPYELLARRHISCESDRANTKRLTRVHFVSFSMKDSRGQLREGIGLYPERVAGVQHVGFEIFNGWYYATDIEKFFEDYDPNRTAKSAYMRASNLRNDTEIDLELNGILKAEAQAGGKPVVTLELERIGNGRRVPVSVRVTCQMVDSTEP